jgi:hypothetical protein
LQVKTTTPKKYVVRPSSVRQQLPCSKHGETAARVAQGAGLTPCLSLCRASWRAKALQMCRSSCRYVSGAARHRPLPGSHLYSAQLPMHATATFWPLSLGANFTGFTPLELQAWAGTSVCGSVLTCVLRCMVLFLQAQKEVPLDLAQCKDKFLVQVKAMDAGEVSAGRGFVFECSSFLRQALPQHVRQG